MTKKPKEQEPWGAVAFVFSLLAVVFIFVFTIGQGSDDSGEVGADQNGLDAPAVDLTPLEAFWKVIGEHHPVYETAETPCLVDSNPLALPFSQKGNDNAAGGIATDLMKIAICPDGDSDIKPNFDLQEFEQKMGTCSTCGAVYMDIDLYNIQSERIENGVEKVKAWDLGTVIPGLKVEDSENWTSDVKAYIRYNVQQQAEFPHNELGFTALAGAYCSNFSSWYGKDFSIPSSAFYALAAAHIRTDLEQDLPDDPVGRSFSAMVLAELYRLLGRSDDAAFWYDYARVSGVLDDKALVVLSAGEESLAAGDFSLKRVPVLEGMEEPPIGWHLDNMLPNINGHLTDERGNWAAFDDPKLIEEKIVAEITARAGY